MKTYSLSNTRGNKALKLHQEIEHSSHLYQTAKQLVAETRQELTVKQREEQRLQQEQQRAAEKEELRKFTPLSPAEYRLQMQQRSSGRGVAQLQEGARAETEAGANKKSVVVSGTDPVGASYKYPFALIHLHREKVKFRAGTGPRRLMKCYFRLCGTMPSCAEATSAAEAVMLNAFMTVFNSKIERSAEVCTRDSLTAGRVCTYCLCCRYS